MEYKNVPYFVKSIDGASRTVVGIFAVHGNRDAGGDVSVNGSFGKRLKMGRSRTRFLWNHDGFQPPIASIIDISEVEKGELPEKVLGWAPEATGGVEVTRKYYEGVPLSEWIFKAVEAGDIEEMSYAYEIHDYEMEMDEEKVRTRILKDVELFDISDVNWGMNPATAGVKGLPVTGLTFAQHSEWMAAHLDEYVKRVQDRQEFRKVEGRVISQAVQVKLAGMSVVIQDILSGCEPKASEEEVRKVLSEWMEIERRLAGIGSPPGPPILGGGS